MKGPGKTRNKKTHKLSRDCPGIIPEGREPPLTLRREDQYLYFGRFFPVRRGLFPVVRDFLCTIPTEQVLYYRNLGLYYGLASGTLPL